MGWTADKAGDGVRISRGSTYANVLVVDRAAPPSALIQQISQQVGDIIVALDRQAVKGVKNLARLMAAHQPGDMVSIVVLRGGKPLEFMLTLAGRP